MLVAILIGSPRKLFPDAIRGNDDGRSGLNPPDGMLTLLEAEFGDSEEEDEREANSNGEVGA